MLWLGYSRVSRVGGREHLISPELQQRRIEEYARTRGWEVRLLDPELDVSGGRVRRPILESAIEAIEAGEAQGLIVSQIDRLSRMAMTSALTVIERIETAGGQVVAVAENVDSTTPEGRMARNMFLSLAAMQRERHAVAIAEAKERAVRHGIWPIHVVPYGYVKGADRRLRFGPNAPKLRAAFHARAAGKSWREVGQILGVGPSSARKIITNRVYLGEITVGEWHNPAAHKPLVERSLWEEAQILHPAPIHRGDGDWLLKGLVRCAGCQRTMSVSEGAYRCLGTAGCDLRARVPYRSLDERGVTLLLNLAGDVAQEAHEPTSQAETIASEVDAAEAELGAFQRATSAAGDVDMFTEGLTQRAEVVRAARAKLANSHRRSALPLLNLVAEWPALDLNQRRHVLSGSLGVVWVWDRERVRFVARGFEPHGLSRPGRKGPEPVALEDAPLEGEVGMPRARYVK